MADGVFVEVTDSGVGSDVFVRDGDSFSKTGQSISPTVKSAIESGSPTPIRVGGRGGKAVITGGGAPDVTTTTTIVKPPPAPIKSIPTISPPVSPVTQAQVGRQQLSSRTLPRTSKKSPFDNTYGGQSSSFNVNRSDGSVDLRGEIQPAVFKRSRVKQFTGTFEDFFKSVFFQQPASITGQELKVGTPYQKAGGLAGIVGGYAASAGTFGLFGEGFNVAAKVGGRGVQAVKAGSVGTKFEPFVNFLGTKGVGRVTFLGKQIGGAFAVPKITEFVSRQFGDKDVKSVLKDPQFKRIVSEERTREEQRLGSVGYKLPFFGTPRQIASDISGGIFSVEKESTISLTSKRASADLGISPLLAERAARKQRKSVEFGEVGFLGLSEFFTESFVTRSIGKTFSRKSGSEVLKRSQVFGRFTKETLPDFFVGSFGEAAGQVFSQQQFRGTDLNSRQIATAVGLGTVSGVGFGLGVGGTSATSPSLSKGLSFIGQVLDFPFELVGDVTNKAVNVGRRRLFNIPTFEPVIGEVGSGRYVFTSSEDIRKRGFGGGGRRSGRGVISSPVSPVTEAFNYKTPGFDFSGFTGTPISSTVESPSNVPSAIRIGGRRVGVNVNTRDDVFSPVPSFIDSTTTPIPSISNIATSTKTSTTLSSAINVIASSNVPVVTPQPRIPFVPPFLGIKPSGQGKGSKPKRKRFENELAAAFNILSSDIGFGFFGPPKKNNMKKKRRRK